MLKILTVIKKSGFARKLNQDKKVSPQKIKVESDKNSSEIRTSYQKIDKEELKSLKNNLPPKNLSPKLLEKCKQVFTKYKHKHIMENGKLYMKLQSQLYSSEQPMDFRKSKMPFQNSKDLLLEMPELKYSLGQRKENFEEPKSKELTNKFQTHEQESKILEYDQNSVIAYLYRRFPESYNIAHRLIREIKNVAPSFKPTNSLDFGAGLSPFAHAIVEEFPEIENITCVEKNEFMTGVGRFMAKELQQVEWIRSLEELRILGEDHKFDFINCSFVLEELPSPELRMKVVNTLLSKLSDGGIATFVLVGTPMGFRFMHDIRSMVIEKPRDEINIIGPCPHHSKCPLARNKKTWCHFEQKWPRYSSQVLPRKKNERNIILSKFSYLTIMKGPMREQETQDEGSMKEFSWDRIISPVIKKSGHRIIELCNSQGQNEKRIVARSFEPIYGFKQSKKLEWGDRWRFPLRLPNKYRREQKDGKKIF